MKLDPESKEWALETSRNLLFGRIDVFPIDEDPDSANIVFSCSALADELSPDTVAFLLAVATVTSGDLQKDLGARFGGKAVFD